MTNQLTGFGSNNPNQGAIGQFVTLFRLFTHTRGIKAMKKSILILLALAIAPAFVAAEEEKSTGSKLLGAAVVKEMDDDSVLKKAVKLDAAGDTLKDDDDSLLKKAAKLKVMDEATKED